MKRALSYLVAASLLAMASMPTASWAFTGTFHVGNIVGNYATQFGINLNDPATAFAVPFAANLNFATAQAQLAKDLKATKCPSGPCANACAPLKGVGLTPPIIAAILASAKPLIGDQTFFVGEIGYDGGTGASAPTGGSLAGALAGGDLSLQKAGSANPGSANPGSGILYTVCGGPNAGKIDAACSKACTVTLSRPIKKGLPEPNCADQYIGATGTTDCKGNPGSTGTTCGGGGYTTTADGLPTSGASLPNNTASSELWHMYASAYGICGSAGSWAECCNDQAGLDVTIGFSRQNITSGATTVDAYGTMLSNWGAGFLRSTLIQ